MLRCCFAVLSKLSLASCLSAYGVEKTENSLSDLSVTLSSFWPGLVTRRQLFIYKGSYADMARSWLLTLAKCCNKLVMEEG